MWTPVQKNQFPTPQILARIYIRSEVKVAAGCVLGVGTLLEMCMLIALKLECSHCNCSGQHICSRGQWSYISRKTGAKEEREQEGLSETGTSPQTPEL